jgi:hypothetical protein
LKIGIIAASVSRQAEVVDESIQSFFKYGNFQYHLITLKRGEISQPLDGLDVLLIHYSCIAFPYRYGLPISALSSFKISQFKGLKLAFAQDEQRAGYERLDFFRSIGINHLFSVAPKSLFKVLYPNHSRNFSVSNLLTGYISEKHIQIASRNIPIADRPIDLSYRGRKLPDWMGLTGTLKGNIPNLLQKNLADSVENLQVDASADEKSRIYGDKWFDFLLRTKVTIGTPSGSDYLDLHGKYSENWIRQDGRIEYSRNEPIKANYNVISPRYFDYVAAGNLIALTSGSYSGIPNEKDYVKIEADMSDIKNVLQFSKSVSAQKMIDRSKLRVLSSDGLKYSDYVRQVEDVILSFNKNYSRTNNINKVIVVKNKLQLRPNFIANIVYRIFEVIKILPIPNSSVAYVRRISQKLKIIVSRKNRMLIKNLPKPKFKDYWNFRLVLEIWRLNEVLKSSSGKIRLNNLNSNSVKIVFSSTIFQPVRKINLQKCKDSDCWLIDLSDYGKVNTVDHLCAIPKQMKYSILALEILIDNLIKAEINGSVRHG